MAYSTLKQPHVGFKNFIPLAMCIGSTCIEELQWCTTDQHYAAAENYSYAIKSYAIDLFYIVGGISSSAFFQIGSMRIHLRGES